MRNDFGLRVGILLVGGMALCSSAATSSCAVQDWFERMGEQVAVKARRQMADGRIVYAPQAGDWYQATWLRDTVMTMEGWLIPVAHLNGIAELFLSAISPEGFGCDCIKFDGTVVRRPGYDTCGENPVLDGHTYMVDIVYQTWMQTKDPRWLKPEVFDKLALTLSAIPRDAENGLPWIDPAKAWDRCPWGFTDSIKKTGNCLFTSLLEIRARRELAYLLREAHRADDAVRERLKAAELAEKVNRVFWDEETGLYLAATAKCRQPDIWGSAFAVWIGVAPDARADRIADYFVANYGNLTQNGQIRHLRAGEFWESTWEQVSPGDYQNGMFWGTATGWFAWTLERRNPALVDRLFSEILEDYRKRGPNERTTLDRTACPEYLASLALPLEGLRRIHAARTSNRRTLADVESVLERKGRELVRGARRKMTNGTELVVFAPQTSNWYDGSWLRDYEMMVEARLIDAQNLGPCADLFWRAVSPDGVGADNVRFDGEVVYVPRQGAKTSSRPVLDGSVYTVCLIHETWRQTGDARWLEAASLTRLAQILAATPHDATNGLAWIDPTIEWERCPWGFTDAVRKKGDCLMTSLLEIRARRAFAEMLEAAGKAADATAERATAQRLADTVNAVFWDEETGLYRAATAFCTQHDIWGSAYAVWLDVAPTARADRVARYFETHYGELVERGQVRHIPMGEWWDLTLYGKDAFQNGPYWGTATGWFCWVLERVNPRLVDRTFRDLVDDYEARGVAEWVLGEHVANLGYVASAALPLQGVRRIRAAREKAGREGK